MPKAVRALIATDTNTVITLRFIYLFVNCLSCSNFGKATYIGQIICHNPGIIYYICILEDRSSPRWETDVTEKFWGPVPKE